MVDPNLTVLEEMFPTIGSETRTRSNGPDLEHLKGDPYDNARYANETIDPYQVQEALAELRKHIDSLPAGALSGGVVYPDEFITEANHEYYPDTRQRHGLTDTEKQYLYDAEASKITRLSRADHEELVRTKAIQAQLWEDYKVEYPDHASSPQVVGAAVARVNASLRSREVDPIKVAARNEAKYLEMVRQEVDYPGYHLPLEEDTGRTYFPSGGGAAGAAEGGRYGYGGYGRQKQEYERPERSDMEEQLIRTQAMSGYY